MKILFGDFLNSVQDGAGKPELFPSASTPRPAARGDNDILSE
jgi:hypothetical protein